MAIPPSKPIRKPRETLVDRGKRLYNPAEFIFPSADVKGHQGSLHTQVRPETAQKISVVMASGRYPYRTQGAFLRHAVELLLAVLRDIEREADLRGIDPTTTAQKESWAQYEVALKASRSRARSKQVVADAEELLKDYREMHIAGDTDELKRQLQALLANAKAMPDIYMSRLTQKIEAEFGFLLHARVVKLNEFTRDDDDES